MAEKRKTGRSIRSEQQQAATARMRIALAAKRSGYSLELWRKKYGDRELVLVPGEPGYRGRSVSKSTLASRLHAPKVIRTMADTMARARQRGDIGDILDVEDDDVQGVTQH